MTLRNLIFPTALFLILLTMTWVVITNYQQVDELRREGKDPVTIATPGTNGRDGLPGARGERGEPGAQGLPGLAGTAGSAGTPGRDGRDGTDGQPGASGQAGRDGTDGQSIKGDPGEPGIQGVAGVQGPVGLTGPQGRAPVLGCVTRTINSAPVNYIAWRYEDEADLAYRNLYRLPTWAQAEECVDLQEAAA